MSRQILFGRPAHPWPAFNAVDDRLRGGKSVSRWKVHEDTATFSGHLDITALGGAGFASQNTSLSPPLDLSDHFTGLALTVRVPSHIPHGHPSAFVLTLKNEVPSRRSDGRRQSVLNYEFAFDLRDMLEEKEKDHEIVAEWKDFKATYRGREDNEAPPLDPKRIEEFSFMCRSNFGSQHGDFSLSIISLAAVRNPFPLHRRSAFTSWWARLCAIITGAWSRLTGRVTGDGRLRLPE